MSGQTAGTPSDMASKKGKPNPSPLVGSMNTSVAALSRAKPASPTAARAQDQKLASSVPDTLRNSLRPGDLSSRTANALTNAPGFFRGSKLKMELKAVAFLVPRAGEGWLPAGATSQSAGRQAGTTWTASARNPLATATSAA